MLCYVLLCYVMLCYDMLCYVMLCYVGENLEAVVTNTTVFYGVTPYNLMH